ncbi:MAG: type II secretion system protein GspC [Polyangiales bacterium]
MASESKKRIVFAAAALTTAVCAAFIVTGARALRAASARTATASPTAPLRVPAPHRKTVDPTPILRRNIFDSEAGDLTQTPITDDSPDGAADVPCSTNAKVLGILHNAHEPDRFVYDGHCRRRYTDGQFNPEAKRLQAPSIVSTLRRFWFRRAQNRSRRVGLFDSEDPNAKLGRAIAVATTTMPTTESPSPAPDRDRNAGLQDDLERGIQKIGSNEYAIDREMFTRVVANPGKLIGIARTLPHTENGKVIGVRIDRVQEKNRWVDLGVENGDILQSVNGHEMATPDAVLQAYSSSLRSADKLSLVDPAMAADNAELRISIKTGIFEQFAVSCAVAYPNSKRGSTYI